MVNIPDVLKEDGKPMSKWKMEYRDFVEKSSLMSGLIRKKLYYI